MTFHRVFQRDSAFFAAPNPFQSALSEIHVFEFLEMLEDRFAYVIRLRAPGATCKLLETLFNRLWKSNGQHVLLFAIQV